MTNELLTVRFGLGWHIEEQDEVFAFRWMGREAELILPPGGPYLSFQAFSEFMDASQVLTIRAGESVIAELPLLHQWTPYSVELPPGTTGAIFALNKVFPREYYPRDGRELGIRVAEIHRHAGGAAHEAVRAFQANAALNARETREGAVVLASKPLSLGIDLHGRCNMSPPCVYCFWDDMKEQEGDRAGTPVDRGTFQGYGPFFTSARTLVNCSIGEPLLNPDLGNILAYFQEHSKLLEMSTNGLAFSERTLDMLLGKRIILYLSLDAATSETFAKIRNDRFDHILRGLERLGAARPEHGGWPKLNMVFMPMKVNRGDLEGYFRLCRDVRADFLVLRPLIRLKHAVEPIERAGYRFDYKEEVLSPGEQNEVFQEARALAETYGVKLLNQFYFGSIQEPGDPAPAPPPSAPLPDLGHGRAPMCTEPWRNYYILRRGILPCCYGHLPIAPMEDFEAAWNGPDLQEIRSHLAQGRFSRYCLESHSCPIVQRCAPPRGEQDSGEHRSAWTRVAGSVDRAAFGLPGKVWKRLRGIDK